MRKVLLIISLLVVILPVRGVEVVYPKNEKATVYANSTFFIGNTDVDVPLFINQDVVKVHSSGNFAHVVELEEGVNSFTVKSGDEIKNFEITKPKVKLNDVIAVKEFIPYDKPIKGIIVADNVPLRTTAQDYGINRITHLQEGVELEIIGEYGFFYKVKLLGDEVGWVGKNVVEISTQEFLPAKILDFISSENDEFDVYEFTLDKKVPFKVVQKPFKLFIYDIDNQKGYFELNPFFDYGALGYECGYDENKLVLKVRKPFKLSPESALDNIKIVVDAGHGGHEIGAIGCSGLKEKDFNLYLAKKLAKEFEIRGAKVFQTRDNDNFVGLNERVQFAKDKDAFIFVSIHGNALPDGYDPNRHSGMSIYYYYNQAKPLADTILKSVTKATGFCDDKVRQQSFAVVRNTKALSVLIEVGYLINPEDNWNMEQEEFQNAVVKAIADGVEEFVHGL